MTIIVSIALARLLSGRTPHEESGATAVEYALMIALVAIVIITAVTFLGVSVKGVFETPELTSALS